MTGFFNSNKGKESKWLSISLHFIMDLGVGSAVIAPSNSPLSALLSLLLSLLLCLLSCLLSSLLSLLLS